MIVDGTMLACGDGSHVYRVFAPRWWEVRRWLAWWFRIARGRKAVGSAMFREETGEEFVARVYEDS